MAWTTELTDTAKKQLSKLDPQIADRITKYIDERVLDLPDPRLIGEGLTGNLQGYWKYRVGDYRLICELRDKHLLVLVIKVGHRKEVYH